MTDPLVIIGAGDRGRIVLDICDALRREVVGFLDDHRSGEVEGLPILGPIGALDSLPGRLRVVVAIDAVGDGDVVAGNRLRRAIGERALAAGRLTSVVHPSAVLSNSIVPFPGAIIGPSVTIGRNTLLSSCCTISSGVTITHDCHLSCGVQIGPGVTIAGRVEVGEDVFLGVGRTWRQASGLAQGRGSVSAQAS